MKFLLAVPFVCHCLSRKDDLFKSTEGETHRLLLLICFRDRRVLQPAQVCDVLKWVILVICYFMMHYVDYSMMYHLIRGQSVIKLYIIYNMLEVSPAGPAHGARRPARDSFPPALPAAPPASASYHQGWPCENARSDLESL